MLCSIKTPLLDEQFDLALVRWYDYKNNRIPDKYECPRLTLTSQYEFVPVESGVELVHIIPRFKKNNEYFVNMFMF
jgi:hypothetical protein